MRNVTKPNLDCYRHFYAIASSKGRHRKNILIGVSLTVQQRYEEYASQSRSLENLTVHPFSLDEKETLIHCYNSQTKNLTNLIEGIISYWGKFFKCQYCGISEAKTMDHYVPKELFPEFSVYADNLLRCCPICNNLKREKFIVGKERQILNLYFDEIPNDKPLLCVNVVIDERSIVPEFYIRDDDGVVSEKILSIARNHFRELDLRKRYSENSNDTITEIRNAIFRHSVPYDELANYIRNEAKRFQETYGINDYRSVLLNAIANSQNFYPEIADILYSRE